MTFEHIPDVVLSNQEAAIIGFVLGLVCGFIAYKLWRQA